MAGRGPAPKPAASRARRNAVPATATLTFTPAAQPDLHAGFPWPEQTREWWARWGRCPQASMFSETDWDFLADTALLHATVWGSAQDAVAHGGKLDLSQVAELRLRVAKLGATVEDRQRLRIEFAEPGDPEISTRPAGHAREMYKSLRVVQSEQSA